MDSGRTYHCSGYVDEVFVNCSRQLDNLLLDGMEPFELEELQPFDFAYAAGQRIKISDVGERELERRVEEQVSSDYMGEVRRTLETKAVEVDTEAESVLRLPVLLPVYYLIAGETAAAVNGQTGKVSVRAAKESHYYFLPWWLKAILAVAAASAAAYGILSLFGLTPGDSANITAMLAVFLIIVALCAYSDTVKNPFRVEAARKIFTSRGGPVRRKDGALVRDASERKKEVTPPIFYEVLDRASEPVRLVFSSAKRKIMTGVLAVTVLFLPVLCALVVNGFDFQRLELGGSAVWFCIMAPLIPVFILKFSVIELYERPWIYPLTGERAGKRWRRRADPGEVKEGARTVLRLLFVPPRCLAFWAIIGVFCLMVYLTAFGFGD